MKRKIIKESIQEAAISPFTYIVLIDAVSVIEKSKGNITYLFPNESPSIVKSWFKKLLSSDNYKKGKEPLKSISARFYNNSSLVALYKAVNTLKKMSYAEKDKERHEKEIQKLTEKISGYIKRRLTDEDDKVIELFLSELNHVAEKISLKIQEEVDNNVEPEEDSSAEKDVKVQERLKNKLRKKIKEIVRTHLLSNR